MTASDPLIDTLVAGRYRVVRPLGHGGMGQVYLAMHTLIEKEVALKVLKPEYSAKEDIISRFQQEAISASRIKHPNVLEVFDFGKLDNGCAFLAMEYLAGNDLADELNAFGSLDVRRALRIALQITRALSAAHKSGVVHRDLKPDNVFLQRTADGEEIVKIVDFGIAQLRSPDGQKQAQPSRRRLTKTGMIFGTPEYMAPEQAAGKNADLRVDIYATGIILFEMLTGGVPFSGESFMGVLNAHMHEPIPSLFDFHPELEVSEELQALITRCLEKDPDARFQTMAELTAALLLTPEAAASQLNPEFAVVAPAPPSSAVGSRPVHPTRAQYAATQASNAKTIVEEPIVSTATPPVRSPASPLRWLAPLALALALVALGAGFWWSSKPAAVKNAPIPQASPPIATTQVIVAVATPEPPPVVAPSASAEEAPAKVRVRVETVPAGAVLSKNGFQVCDSTPCDLDLKINEGAEFDAVAGKLRGRAKVLAQQAQTVSIRLLAPKAAKPQMCEALSADGLKILRPCP
jgi:eukaryotic-like serine/threonine-protein kinase